MTGWNGLSLPPAVADRIARNARSPLAAGYADPRGMVALQASGLQVVGEVLGVAVMNPGGFGAVDVLTCSYDDNVRVLGIRTEPTPPSDPLGLAELGYAQALRRLLAEARGIAADGVVGVQVATSPDLVPSLTGEGLAQAEWTGLGVEFTVRGTAVRWNGGAASGRDPFLTTLTAAGVLSLLAAGWVPVQIVIGLGAGIAHIRQRGRWQLRALGATGELTNHTEALTGASVAARRALAVQVSRTPGAAGAILGQTRISRGHKPCLAGWRDFAAVAQLTGTAVAPSGDLPTSGSGHEPRGVAGSGPLTVLPLGGRGRDGAG